MHPGRCLAPWSGAARRCPGEAAQGFVIPDASGGASLVWLLYARLVFLAALVGVTAVCVWAEMSSREGR